MFWFGLALSAVGMMAQMGAQAQSAKAQRAAANYSALVDEQNALAYDRNVIEASRMGGEAVEDVRRNFVQAEGDTLAAFAANGMDVNSASSLAYLAQGAESANIDADIARRGFDAQAREQANLATASRQNAAFSRKSGQAAYNSGMLSAAGTFASGLGNAWSNYQRYSSTPGTSGGGKK